MQQEARRIARMGFQRNARWSLKVALAITLLASLLYGLAGSVHGLAYLMGYQVILMVGMLRLIQRGYRAGIVSQAYGLLPGPGQQLHVLLSGVSTRDRFQMAASYMLYYLAIVMGYSYLAVQAMAAPPLLGGIGLVSGMLASSFWVLNGGYALGIYHGWCASAKPDTQ